MEYLPSIGKNLSAGGYQRVNRDPVTAADLAVSLDSNRIFTRFIFQKLSSM
jgi:hypothetical protein